MKVVPSLLAALFAMNAFSATDTPSPEAAGFSASKLQRLTEKFAGDARPAPRVPIDYMDADAHGLPFPRTGF